MKTVKLNPAQSLQLIIFIFVLALIFPFDEIIANEKSGNIDQWKNLSLQKAPDGKFGIDKDRLIRISERLSKHINERAINKSGNGYHPSLRESLDKNNLIQLKDTAGRTNLMKSARIHWNAGNNTPAAMIFSATERDKFTALQNKASRRDFAEHALQLIKENHGIFKLRNPYEELQITDAVTDDLGKTHVTMKQQYREIPLWGHDLVFHYDEAGRLYAMNARYAPTPSVIDPKGMKLTAQQAIQIAIADLSNITEISNHQNQLKKILKYESPEATKYIWRYTGSTEFHLVWHVHIRPNFRDSWYYFIDAVNAEILEKYNATNFDGPVSATGTDLMGINRNFNVYQVGSDYIMIDGSRPIWQTTQPDILNDPKGALWTIDVRGNDLSNQVQLFNITSANNTWSDPAAVSSHYNVGQVFEYFFNTHGRQAIDGKGNTIISVIHVTSNNQPMDNAYWNGAVMAYGDGNIGFEPLGAALDVAGHEMSHGVIQHTVNLEYKFQSGAINESLADVFGVMVDREDWLIGEDITKTSYIASGALRNMEDPNNGGSSINDNGWQPAHMNEYLNLTIDQDNGGVHVNSGIPNRAAFLIGNTIGKDKAEKIYYRILDARYLNTQSNFVDLRLAAIRAAEELYGASSTEVNAVIAAFDAVGIVGDTGTPPPDDLPAVQGEQWIATVNSEEFDNSLFLVRPVITTENDIIQLTSTQIFTSSGKPITVSDDGSLILFIDNANYVRLIGSDGSGEEVISDEGIWKSIALSPDLSKLAATSVFEDSTIYIFDLVNANNSKVVQLYGTTSQDGIKTNVTVYADVLDWDLNSQFIIYDALNRIPQSTDEAIEYWDINILDVQNELIFPIFPPQPEGISVGNPAFARTNSNFFVFDYVDFNQGSVEIWAVDLYTGSTGLIVQNGASIGYPRYSTDDSRLVFQRWNSDSPALFQIPLEAGKTQAAGPEVYFVQGGQLPYWFSIGTRPQTDVESEEKTQPVSLALHQNYPNPFNPETSIDYELKKRSQIQLSIFDITGREIAVIENGVKAAGEHSVKWNGKDKSGNAVTSGIYFYRLSILEVNGGNSVLTRKMTLLK